MKTILKSILGALLIIMFGISGSVYYGLRFIIVWLTNETKRYWFLTFLAYLIGLILWVPREIVFWLFIGITSLIIYLFPGLKFLTSERYQRTINKFKKKLLINIKKPQN